MKICLIEETTHEFIKENLVTVSDSKGMYDIFVCSKCGVKAKSYQLGYVRFDGRSKNPNQCSNADVAVRVKVSKCDTHGPQFRNLLPGSIHDVVESPDSKYKNGESGYWVMGIGEPVRLLPGEYRVLDDEK